MEANWLSFGNNMKPSLVFFFTICCCFLQAQQAKQFTFSHGAIVRGDSTKKEVALVFTADEWGEGLPPILQTLKKENVDAGFFFTGRFYRNKIFQKNIKALNSRGHYLGPHSDEHLLYCDWTNRHNLLVTKDSFSTDISANMDAMKALGLLAPKLFIPPFEWWNDSVAAWSKEMSLTIFNFTPGLRTAADYTWPEMGAAYKTSNWLLANVKEKIVVEPSSLNGAIILLHAGTDARRKDKLYSHLGELIKMFKKAGFSFVRIDRLLSR
jgi:peptidoglycan/xylan/chitin deacetylase (PgdA/CDA1 family)